MRSAVEQGIHYPTSRQRKRPSRVRPRRLRQQNGDTNTCFSLSLSVAIGKATDQTVCLETNGKIKDGR